MGDVSLLVFHLRNRVYCRRYSYLDKANVGRLLTEALTADVKAVLADETGLVCADSAIENHVALAGIFHFFASIKPFRKYRDVPGTRALAVSSRARVPDGFVRHVDGCVVAI